MGKECQCSCLWYPGTCPGAAHILWSLSATFRGLKTPTVVTREGISTWGRWALSRNSCAPYRDECLGAEG